jgi:5'-3' exonuclease
MPSRPILVVDGLSVFHSTTGPAAFLRNGFTYSFVIQLTSAIKKFTPRGVFVCWDSHSKKRLELHPGYKAQRESSMNDDKRKMLEDVKRFLQVVGADQLWAEGYEADDIGAMLANNSQHAVLVSNDKDWLQLVRKGVSVYARCKTEGRKSEKKLVTESNFAQLSGWNSPEHLVQGLCAMGDAVDGIDGIFGVGDVTVKKYLLGMPVGEVTQAKLDEFFAGSPLYQRNRKLIELRDITKVEGIQMTVGQFDERAVKSLLEELTFASMLKNFPQWVQPYKEACADLSPLS